MVREAYGFRVTKWSDVETFAKDTTTDRIVRSRMDNLANRFSGLQKDNEQDDKVQG